MNLVMLLYFELIFYMHVDIGETKLQEGKKKREREKIDSKAQNNLYKFLKTFSKNKPYNLIVVITMVCYNAKAFFRRRIEPKKERTMMISCLFCFNNKLNQMIS